MKHTMCSLYMKHPPPKQTNTIVNILARKTMGFVTYIHLNKIFS